MKKRNSIAIAKRLAGHLPMDMADELNILIARSERETGDPTRAIIHLLKKHQNSLLWFLEQLEAQSGPEDGSRGFGPLAGNSSAAVSNKWVCPMDSSETLPVMQEGEPAPKCDQHKMMMVRKQ